MAYGDDELAFRRMIWVLWGLSMAFPLAGMVMLAMDPSLGQIFYGAPARPGLVHLLTLGGVLGCFHALYAVWLRRLYGVCRWQDRLLPWLAGLHGTGVAVLAAGFMAQDALWLYVGGHYLVPMGVGAAAVTGVLASWQREPGLPRNLLAHLPLAGLFVTAGFGVMMVTVVFKGGYHFEFPHAVLMHALSAGFLFALPLLMVADRMEDGQVNPRLGGVLWSTLPGGLGVVVMAVGLWAQPAAPWYQAGLGLAALGAVLAARPRAADVQPLRSFQRLPWLAVAVMLVFAAISLSDDIAPDGAYTLSFFIITLMLLGVVLPPLMLHGWALPRGQAPFVYPWEPGLYALMQWTGTGMVLAGQTTGMGGLIRSGGVFWAAALGAMAWRTLDSAGIKIRRRWL
ncbi:MAG: hypothetical protein OEV94_08760 [Deltaproteobacteria bacterium]|nr:hypothetical protein [Deltaproteobacteria bacterium]